LESHLSGQVFAFTFALMGAIFCFVLEKLFKEKQEALMGCSFVVVACAGLLLASQGSHGAEHVENMLAGQLLWVSRVDVVILAAIALLVGFVHWMRRHLLDRSLVFYIVLSTCVTSSVQVIGVYLVFASLMMPALVGAKHKSMAFTKSLLAGSLGYALGIVLSVWFDLPTGAVVVCSLALCCALIGLLLPRR
jgi:zinc/manganese transport system permease protein